jgi:hypothetical protein
MPRHGFHDAAPGIEIHFNQVDGTIHVFEYTSLVPGFHGDWQEVASFANDDDWYASKYARMITSEDMEDMILWHWIDLSTPTSDSIPSA